MWTPPTKWDKEKLERAMTLCRRTLSIRHYLHSKQKEVYDLLRRPGLAHAGLYCSRKTGKSFFLLLDAYEFCWRNPNTTVRFVLPELKQARETMLPIANEFKAFLPPELLPTPKLSELKLVFPNGAIIALGGAKKENAESNRGPIAHRIYRDECAAWEDSPHYEYITYSILLPQATTTEAMLIDATTPPKSPTHPWVIQDLPRLKQNKAIVTFDIDESPLLTEEQIDKIVERYGGRDNPDFRREYKLELISDTSLRVTPEFNRREHVKTDEYLSGIQAFSEPMPTFGYCAADLGVKDFTGILGAVYIPSENQVMVIGEDMYKGEGLDFFAEAHKKMNRHAINHLHGDGMRVPVKWTIDCFEQAGMSLRKDKKIAFQRPFKRKLIDNIGFLRLQLGQGRVLIHESCHMLIDQLENGLWKESTGKEDNADFERTSVHGHLDLLAALVYLVRMIPWGRNPAVDGNQVSFRGGIGL
jgi:hypothetical protein